MADITATGTMIEGLRADCRVLQTSSRRWALVGPGTEQLQEGQTVTVTGHAELGAKNPCGQVFVVTAIH